jgi:hypothetical protein
MTTNKYFRPFTYGRQQDLAEDLIIQSIKIYGLDVKYLPRTLNNPDPLLGEDPASTFDDAVDIEMYIKNTQQFEGEGDFLSKFNLEIRDQITFVMARKRWEQITNEKILTEVGYNIQLEDADTGRWANSVALRLESGSANGYSLTSSRPLEGDWIYFPLNKKLYEVKFVEHENIFYQHGKLYTYELTCELVDRMGAIDINTGNTEIDAIETRYSQDILNYQITLESSDGSVLNEDGESILWEYRVEEQVKTANNEFFTQKSFEYIDFSERNPFSEVDRY